MGYILRKCDVCGKEYFADERNIKRGWGLCCSKSCAAIKRERNKLKIKLNSIKLEKENKKDDDTLEKYLEYKCIMKNEYENKNNHIFTMVTSFAELNEVVNALREKKYYCSENEITKIKNELLNGRNIYVGVFSNNIEFSLGKKHFSKGLECKCKYYRKKRIFLDVVSIAYIYYKNLWWHNVKSKYNKK